jgi:exodeoxyribonuclease V alpha subunit
MKTQLNRAAFNIEFMVTSQTTGNFGSQILHGKRDGRQHSVVVRAYVLVRAAQPGEWWSFTGEWDTNPRYPNQMIANHGEPLEVHGERLAEYIIRNPKFRVGERATRVGEKTWQKAIEKAGDADQLAELLNKENREAIRVLGVGRLTHNIDLVLNAWSIQKGELAAVALCREHHIPKRLSNRLIKQYGETLPAVLKTDCYKLLAFDNNTKSLFDNCQKIADAMDYPTDDPRRLQGAVDFILNFRLEKFGHTAIARETLLEALTRHFKTSQLAERAIKAALGSGAIQQTPEGLLQSRPVAFAEAMLEQRFVNMIKYPIDKIFDKLLTDKAEQVYEIAENPKPKKKQNKKRKPNTKIALTDEQKGAIKLPFQQQFSIITGGAGTGKTTVISSVVRLAQALNIQVFQMALSGQAAAVMRSYNEDHDIDCLSRTIHSYIIPFEKAEEEAEEDEEERSSYIEVEDFPSDCLIIIDESSMNDLSLMIRLLTRLPVTARIVMIGDHNQIPPVGAGLVFHLLCQSKNVPIAKLTKAHRSAAETGIPLVAENISQGIVPAMKMFDLGAPRPDHGVFFMPTTIDRADPHSLAKVIYQVADKLGLKRTQVITTHRQRSNQGGHIVQSIHHINEYFQSQLTTENTQKIKAWGLNEGDPVIVRKNVIDVGGCGFDLYNGSLGKLTSATNTYTFNFADQLRVLDNDSIAKLGIMLGYALTVHSFQGSAAECIVIAVTKSNMLERSLLYTALTRAKKTVVFVGDQQAFNAAVEAPAKWETIQTGFSIDRSFMK